MERCSRLVGRAESRLASARSRLLSPPPPRSDHKSGLLCRVLQPFGASAPTNIRRPHFVRMERNYNSQQAPRAASAMALGKRSAKKASESGPWATQPRSPPQLLSPPLHYEVHADILSKPARPDIT